MHSKDIFINPAVWTLDFLLQIKNNNKHKQEMHSELKSYFKFINNKKQESLYLRCPTPPITVRIL